MMPLVTATRIIPTFTTGTSMSERAIPAIDLGGRSTRLPLRTWRNCGAPEPDTPPPADPRGGTRWRRAFHAPRSPGRGPSPRSRARPVSGPRTRYPSARQRSAPSWLEPRLLENAVGRSRGEGVSGLAGNRHQTGSGRMAELAVAAPGADQPPSVRFNPPNQVAHRPRQSRPRRSQAARCCPHVLPAVPDQRPAWPNTAPEPTASLARTLHTSGEAADRRPARVEILPIIPSGPNPADLIRGELAA